MPPMLTKRCFLPTMSLHVVWRSSAGYRFELLGELISGQRDVSSLAQAIGASLCTTSRNLRCLRDLKLVQYEKSGLRSLYRLAKHVKVEVEDDAIALTFPASGNRQMTIRISSHDSC